MWRLKDLFARPRRRRAAGTAGGRPSRRTDDARQRPDDLARVAAEVEAVAHYVANLKREIAFLRGNDIVRNRLPSVQADVSEARAGLGAAAASVLTSCEDLLADGTLSEGARANLTTIVEACCFADVLAQRLTRVDASLDYVLTRLQRFTLAIGIDDREHPLDGRREQDRLRQAAMLSGPQETGERTGQAEIDRLFAN